MMIIKAAKTIFKTVYVDVIIDDDCFELVKDKDWKLDDKGYVYTYTHDHKTRLSRLILGITNPNIQVDHIDRNKLNNRKENLRLCDNSQNCSNQPERITNKVGYKGVSFDRKGGIYRATICKDYACRLVHYSNNPVHCAYAYNLAAKILHKEFAYMNNVDNLIDTDIKQKIEADVKRRLGLC